MKILLLVAITAMCSASEYDTRFLPRVMFWCGKVNQHIDLWTGEWTTDRDGVSGCIPVEDKSAILDYCRKVYPSKTITNVVEDHRLGESSTWCERGNDDCHYSSSRPAFQCVVGHFETRALNVPDGCIFRHYYNDGECLSHGSLHEIAVTKCQSPTPVLRDYGKIIECGLDQFRGVEYVCCPEEQAKPTEAIPEAKTTTESVTETITKTTTESVTESVTDAVTQKVVVPFLVRDEVVVGKFDAEPEEPMTEGELATEPEPTMPPVPVLIHDESHVTTLADTLDFKQHCDRKLLHKLYIGQRQHLDEEARKRMATVLQHFQHSMQAARELKLREPEAAVTMEEVVKSKFRTLVEDSERMAAGDRKTLKAGHSKDLQNCYKERLCKGLQMFMTVLSENPSEAKGILDGVNKVLEQELEDHRTAASVPVQSGRHADKQRHRTMLRINQQIKFARLFLVAANEALHTGEAVFPMRGYDCPLAKVGVSKTEAPEVETVAATEFLEETKGPVLPDFTGLLEPGPVIFEGDSDTDDDEVTETIEKLSETVSETKSAEKVHDTGVEWKSPSLAHGSNDSPVNAERNSGSSKSKSSTYLGLAIGLSVGAAVMVFSLLALYAYHQRHRRGNYEVDLVDDDDGELALKREEDELQENGYENPAYKFFEEMDDGDE